MLLVIFENTDYNSAIADPNLKAFASSGVLFSNWDAIAHPSQPNYIAMTSGSTNGITSDSSSTINVKNIADLIEAKGLTWKSYQENWPGNCFTGTESTDGLYFRLVNHFHPLYIDVMSDILYRKHNPFISYTDIQKNSTRCAKIVDAPQLSTDISNGQLPTFAWYTVNNILPFGFRPTG